MSNCDSALSAYKFMLWNIDPSANLTRTYEENKYMVYIWIAKGYYYEKRGEKTHGRDRLYVRDREVADCKSKDRRRSNR